jgi:ABC-type uncharacterized transport system involved in gliding motility auxiliary subunit
VDRPAATCRGSAVVLALHTLLLLLVLGQIVYLASRYRVRIDLTSDQLWSSTPSTRTVLDKLDQQLVIDAYFSPKEKLPVQYRETRSWADSFLDELVQVGAGKVVVRRFDPNADKAPYDTALQLGVKPLEIRSQSTTGVSFDLHWQGLRLRLGDKQKVIPTWTPTSSFLAEAVLTPAIKEVATGQKHKFGYMEWPVTAVGAQQASGIGWNALRTLEPIQKRFEFQNYKDEDGALLPADLERLFLFRPKELTDRQKYVIDQFVMRGGTLVVFADAAEYAIGPQRLMTRIPLLLDAPGSKRPFVDQLLHYGIEWKPKVLADLQRRAYQPLNPLEAPQEYFAQLVTMQNAYQQMLPVEYQYFFHACNVDWSLAADERAKGQDGKVDADAAASYKKRFVNGMPSDEFVFKAFKDLGRGPGFYWPTWVGLRERAGGVLDLPAGVEGRVLLWSSPFVLAEDPPPTLNPFGAGVTDARQRDANRAKFQQKLMERYYAEPPQQAPLMVDVRGTFASAFANGERPRRPSELREAEAKAKEQAKGAPADDPKTPTDASKATAEAGPQPATSQPDGAGTAAAEPAPRKASEKPGRIVVIGDADFVRDDLVQGVYARAGGPASGGTARPFFAQLLDWLVEDQDLVALQSRAAVDRSLKFADGLEATADARTAEQTLRRKITWLRGLNVVLPGALLALFGLVLLLWRRAEKRRFLASLR